jgi:hypothetical protein
MSTPTAAYLLVPRADHGEDQGGASRQISKTIFSEGLRRCKL